jgi:hypothetical protein
MALAASADPADPVISADQWAALRVECIRADQWADQSMVASTAFLPFSQNSSRPEQSLKHNPMQFLKR